MFGIQLYSEFESLLFKPSLYLEKITWRLSHNFVYEFLINLQIALSLHICSIVSKTLKSCSGNLNTELVWYSNGRKEV